VIAQALYDRAGSAFVGRASFSYDWISKWKNENRKDRIQKDLDAINAFNGTPERE